MAGPAATTNKLAGGVCGASQWMPSWWMVLVLAAPVKMMLGCCSKARTKTAGFTQAACGCHRATADSGSMAAMRCCMVAGALQAAASGRSCHTVGSLLLPSTQCSTTPVAPQSCPSVNKARTRCSVQRMPARVICEIRVSSAEVWGTISPTGSPEAPAAGWGAVSCTCTCQPRCAKLQAQAAPLRPAPSTSAVPAEGMGGAGNQCGA